jgi:transposase
MAQAICYALRQSVWERIQQGHSLVQISSELNIPYGSIRVLNRRFRERGIAALEPNYAACGRQTSVFAPVLRETCIQLHQQNEWGVGRIRVEFVRLYPDLKLPSERTMSQWLYEKKMHRTPRTTSISQNRGGESLSQYLAG